ncbi:hypothetical protein F6X37_17295 [Paraburkholderia sp. 31.1]|nr:hypothetical protein [Paraburkholderia sp. 31.1]
MGSNPTRPTKVSKKGFRIPEPFFVFGRPSAASAGRPSASLNPGERRPLPHTPPDTDPLAPGSSPEDEEALKRAPRQP